jgi:hypothetical protein
MRWFLVCLICGIQDDAHGRADMIQFWVCQSSLRLRDLHSVFRFVDFCLEQIVSVEGLGIVCSCVL